MFKNYLITSIRFLSRNSLFFFINIIGLAVGLATFFMAYLFINDEVSYDKFHTKHEKIYRVVGSLMKEDQGETPASCVFGLAPSLKNDYPHYISSAVRFFNFQDPQHTLSNGTLSFSEEGIFMADSNVFEVFDFKLIRGDRKTVLDEPNCIVITEELAKKYFKSEDPIGKVLRFDNLKDHDLKVTGILARVPAESHIHFNALISFSTLKKSLGPNLEKNWVWNPCWTYVELKEGISPQQVNAKFPEFVQKYYPDHLKPQVKHVLQPLAEIHLHSKLDFEIEPNGEEKTLYIFGVIGFFVLVIAIINFTNLSTAKSASRMKEIGIRKATGASRFNLVVQFLSESIFVTFIAFIFSLVFIELLLPLFNYLSGKEISILSIFEPFTLMFSLASTLLTGILAGAFPAFYISSVGALNSIKNAGDRGGRFSFQKVLVLFQFTITSCLLVASGMVYSQLEHLQSKELGFDKEQLLMVPVRPPMAKGYEPFMNGVKGISQVSNITVMNDILGKKHNNHEYNFKDMKQGDWVYYPTLIVDENFIKTMGITLLEGRDYDKNLPREDTFSIVVNEAMVKQMGWTPKEAIGKRFNSLQGDEKIVGVVKDFNFVSLLSPVRPFVLDIAYKPWRNYWTRYIAIRLNSGNHQESISKIEKIWKTAMPDFPFQYFFLNDELNHQYKPQQNLGRLTLYFSVVAILIACLGIFALSTFKARQRSKEIAIRKVLGGDRKHLVYIMVQPFLLLVVMANIIAAPLSIYLVRTWQEQFAYKAEFNYLLILITFLSTLLIAFLTLYFRVIKVSRSTPVKYLRTE